MAATHRALGGGVLAALRDSWALSLQARNLSPKTVRLYLGAASDLLGHLAATGGPGVG